MEEKETKESKMEKWVKEHEPHIAGGLAIIVGVLFFLLMTWIFRTRSGNPRQFNCRDESVLIFFL